MADSNITKKALADALKRRMQRTPLTKITVGDICESCDMNRKSFYYHFQDKDALVNWIFDTEFLGVVKKNGCLRGWDFLQALCRYLYENRDFYRRALQFDGQNSFRSHFHEIIRAAVAAELGVVFAGEQVPAFHVTFVTDGFVCALERWIMGKDCIAPDEFLEQILYASNALQRGRQTIKYSYHL